jgi:carbamoyltransferase
MKLGISLSHDSSAAVTQSDGVVINALAEERISRVKNHFGIPRQSISLLLKQELNHEIDEIIIGSHKQLSWAHVFSMLSNLEDNPSNKPGSQNLPYPSFVHNVKKLNLTPHEYIESKLEKIFTESGKKIPSKITWINHHDSHLGCAIGAADTSDYLLVSLDGHGDGESGAISLMNRSPGSNLIRTDELLRIPALDSLGLLYSAVTRRYNFKASQHEGKITGLAAFGSNSSAFEILAKHVSVRNGVPRIDYVKSLKARLLTKSLRRLGFNPRQILSLEELVDLAETPTSNYADLAWAVQELTEKCVLELLEFWSKRTGVANFALAGGVFANVKVNQKIAESSFAQKVKVFPNMGDGGISLGGVWFELAKRNELYDGPLYKNMFLAPPLDVDFQMDPEFTYTKLTRNQITELAAQAIAKGEAVAIHDGPMEFGPRALGNRSLLLDPRDRNILQTINHRLQRTEFMPFAPIVLEDDFRTWFQTSSLDLDSFGYMTMTCEVREDKRDYVPAITHVDGTARPQIINHHVNSFVFEIVSNFKRITGVPIVVNTSLNIHEEPINYVLADSLRALKRGAVDVIFTSEYKINLN